MIGSLKDKDIKNLKSDGKCKNNDCNDSIERYDSDLSYGLSLNQVEQRKNQGLCNYQIKPRFKTTKQIFASNIFTYFNIINFILAICVLAVGSFRNVFFIGVVICNIFIGIFQELKVRNIIKKLEIVSQPNIKVIREGKECQIDISEIVLDDVVKFEAGNQIVADSVVKQGFVEVNESLITGESDLILKKSGDKLISGSFVVAGSCVAKVENVGNQTYVSKILTDVGKYRSTKSKSQIMKYINTVVKIVAALIFPIGFLRFYKEFFLLHNSLQNSVVFTVASVIGMIPEGIVLMTSVALMIGVVRLSKLKTLTQDLFSLETLAKVDVLCLDKTGTLTQGDIEVEKIIPLNSEYDLKKINVLLQTFCLVTEDKNATIVGLKNYVEKLFKDKKSGYQGLGLNENAIEEKISFSSERKWSGFCFKNGLNMVLGAPEVLLSNRMDEYQSVVDGYLNQGKRILVVGLSESQLQLNVRPEIKPVGFVVMVDKIRKSAIETISFFKDQGVAIKIISGDNPKAVARIAKLVGIDDSENYIDSSVLKTEHDVDESVKKYNIFGRANPTQKKQIINSYKKLGFTVGMIGDGVNDILALKDADCSIAMAQGSDAARQISKFVLLNSDFRSVPNIVNEGRRVINNIVRAASMFLIKNIYSLILSLILLFFPVSYPFRPVQLTLIGTLTIGLPSFFLVLEQNKSPIKFNFFKKVLSNALPPSMAIIINILFLNIASRYLINFDMAEISTMAVILTGLCNLMALNKISKSDNLRHKIVMLTFLILFLLSVIFLKNIFLLSSLNLKIITVMLILGLYSYWQINLCFDQNY